MTRQYIRIKSHLGRLRYVKRHAMQPLGEQQVQPRRQVPLPQRRQRPVFRQRGDTAFCCHDGLHARIDLRFQSK